MTGPMTVSGEKYAPEDFPRPASHDRPADVDGTFDVPEVGEPLAVPPEVFSIPARDLAIAFLKGAQRAPALKGPDGNPRRGTKNQAQYLQAFIRHLGQALERI